MRRSIDRGSIRGYHQGMAKNKEWADFFNGHAPVYEQNSFTKNTTAEVDFLTRELDVPPGGTILDVGCGTGRHSIELARRGYRVTGLDMSAGMLEEAARHTEAAGVVVKWIQSDAAAFSLSDRFDAVICLCEGAFGLLSSGDDPIGQPLAILRNAASVLKPRAKCIFTVLNGYASARRHTQAEVEPKIFDPLTFTERSDCIPPGAKDVTPLRERGFVPTELTLLFGISGLEVEAMWGGTAGNWGKRSIELDEMEIMVTARKAPGSALRSIDILGRLIPWERGRSEPEAR
jgi:2-polyprenyl-3-methyl-5-hydroxy-6-metoxy-1,4-benzoquinol methylase